MKSLIGKSNTKELTQLEVQMARKDSTLKPIMKLIGVKTHSSHTNFLFIFGQAFPICQLANLLSLSNSS